MKVSLCTNKNIAERKFLGNLLEIFKAPIRIGTMAWAEKFRIMTSVESSTVGRFNKDHTP